MQGLDLLTCVADDQRAVQQVRACACVCAWMVHARARTNARTHAHLTCAQLLPMATTLKYEFYRELSAMEPSDEATGGVCVHARMHAHVCALPVCLGPGRCF